MGVQAQKGEVKKAKMVIVHHKHMHKHKQAKKFKLKKRGRARAQVQGGQRTSRLDLRLRTSSAELRPVSTKGKISSTICAIVA